MPSTFEIPGLSFQYPDNWTLDEETRVAEGTSVTVYSPTGAFWSIARYPRSADPAQLIRAAVEAMRQEYDSLESHETRATVAGRELAGYDLFFYCLDLTNTAQVLATSIGDWSYVLFAQAEDHDFERLGPVFRAMATSLLSGLPGPAEGEAT